MKGVIADGSDMGFSISYLVLIFPPKNYDCSDLDVKIWSIYNILRYADVHRGDEQGCKCG